MQVDGSGISQTDIDVESVIRQIVIRRWTGCQSVQDFERKLFVMRNLAELQVKTLKEVGAGGFYLSSMSARTLVYKGMLLASQVGDYYLDLMDIRFTSALALVHQRFSTNTFPSWELSHPFRMIGHNGEFNTLRGT